MTVIKRNRILSFLIALMLVFIWGNSLLSREISGAISDGLMDLLDGAAAALGLPDDLFVTMHDQDGDGVEEPTSLMLRKAAHVTEFAVFTALVWLRLDSGGRKRFLTALGCGVLTGAIDEALQILSHRGSQVQDIFIDSAGALLGAGIAAIIAFRRTRSVRGG